VQSYKFIQPPESLKNYVKFFWVGDIMLDTDHSFTHLAIANSKPELLFRYAGDYITTDYSGKESKVFSAGLFGQTNQYKEYKAISKNSGFLGVRFYPHALPALFNIISSEVSNDSIDITTLLGNEGTNLEDKILEADNADDRISLVIQFLETRIKYLNTKYQSIENAIRVIHHCKGQILMPSLISNSCLSERQFERSFKELAGFSAKAYTKIVRFESAVEAFENKSPNSKKSLTDLALDFGYYDQPHFNHEFKIFTGKTPSAYFNFKS
jgi:AraC-like DNA-binding protein